MALEFKGNIDELKNKIVSLDYDIVGERPIQNGYQIKVSSGVIVNFYNTGKLQIQGREEERNLFEKIIRGILNVDGVSDSRCAVERINNNSPMVFVVHGHDQIAREQLELILHKLGIEPYVLANTGGGGLTIIENLENDINKEKLAFGIVLMTPDDYGRSKDDPPENEQPRARQNVVLEMGMLLSALGRPRVAILKKGHVEAPSDASGIIYIPFNDHVKETVPKLAQRLKDAGFNISAEDIAKAST